MNDDLQFTVQTEGHTVIFRVKDDVDMNGAVFTQVVEATIVLPEARDLKVMVSSYRRFSGKGMDLKKALDDVYSLVENTSIRHFVMVAANEYSLQALFARVMSGVVTKWGLKLYYRPTIEQAVELAKTLD